MVVQDVIHTAPSSDEGRSNNSLIIPITSGTDPSLFVEIFPDELKDVPVATLLKVLQAEKAAVSIWADAAVRYMQEKMSRDSLTLLQAAGSSAGEERNVRVLAATGIAHLAVAAKSSSGSSGSSSSSTNKEDSTARDTADQKFTQAAALDTFFPMTWMGRGMWNLSAGRAVQAKFFFQTTLKECGPVLPGILGMAAVLYGEGKFQAAQTKYAEAIRRYPVESGAATRVGFAYTCYQLGQVDRAKAAFQRALQMDPECVEAMVGAAVLDMAGTGSGSTESAIKRMSMANLLDHSNAMVQNHLANHYFWKWTAVAGAVSLQHGSRILTSSQPMPLEAGEPVRIGTKFETTIVEVLDDDDDDSVSKYRLGAVWKEPDTTGLKLWKKDYERVFALAKGAYSSTSVPEIQAESLFFLARTYHVKEENDNALKLYDRACKLAPQLTPARFGWAQTLIVQDKYDEAVKELKQLLTISSNATDAYALLGLLEVRAGKLEEGLAHLRKAMELDPANPDLVVLEALALQQHKSDYSKSLQRYEKAVDLMKRQGSAVPYQIYTNLGVLCHETRQYEQALDMYRQALTALKDAGDAQAATLQTKGIDGIRIVHPDNDMFYEYVDSGFKATEESTNMLKLVDATDVDSLPMSVGEHIRVGESFVTEIVKIESVDGSIVVKLKDTYDPMVENDEGEATTVSIAVKRENKLLEIDEATTVAFNIARLHEASGKTLAAIELHKAIAKRNPAYVNSYLRLACIAVDCGSLNECAQWLKIAAVSAPGNSEVLTLIGNLHLSLCDWKPAQKVFDGLMAQKIPSVEAYSALSMGNIYFANLHVSEHRYAKHLQYASEYYKKILGKDPLNVYAANGIGTVLAEKGEIFKAKEVFNRVREVSGDSIADALLNLGHIYLAQKKHPEALQLYKSYMKRAEDGTTPITSKTRTDDVVDVLLYIAFAYFDWARHTELFNDVNAAPADGRYKQALEHLEVAISKHSKKEVILKYNLCMTKLQAANCVLQKLTRNIPRTVEEVEQALTGLEESLVVVEEILKDKEEGDKKINIRTSILEDFLKHCRANITSAQSHLEDEKKRAEEEKDEQEIRRLAAEAAQTEAAIQEAMQREEETKKQEERDQKADAKMRKVEELRSGWQQEQESAQTAKSKKSKKQAEHPDLEEEDAGGGTHGLFDDSDDESDAGTPAKGDNELSSAAKGTPSQSDLFGDSDDSDDEAKGVDDRAEKNKEDAKGIFEDSDDDVEFGASGAENEKGDSKPAASSKDLFGDSDEESDEELVPTATKRGNEESNGEDSAQPMKKRRLAEDDEED
jgi:RNA polymerase-associated protein CTR9